MNAQGPGSSQQPDSASGQSPEEIEHDIEHTRDELGRTIDALKWRLSPRERLAAAADSARATGRRLAQSAGNSLLPSITNMIRLDHTHVLALFRRFRPWTSAQRKQALVANACLAIDIHAQLEEEIFYPALRDVPGPTDILNKSEPEHDEMRNLIGRLRAMDVDDPVYDDTFRELMRTVVHHVADEESVLLPLAETHLSTRLGELGRQMTVRRMELLRPHLGEVAVTTARSFPMLTIGFAAGLLGALWLVSRPLRSLAVDRQRERTWF